jgi:hypothetical protein
VVALRVITLSLVDQVKKTGPAAPGIHDQPLAPGDGEQALDEREIHNVSPPPQGVQVDAGQRQPRELRGDPGQYVQPGQHVILPGQVLHPVPRGDTALGAAPHPRAKQRLKPLVPAYQDLLISAGLAGHLGKQVISYPLGDHPGRHATGLLRPVFLQQIGRAEPAEQRRQRTDLSRSLGALDRVPVVIGLVFPLVKELADMPVS